MSETTEWLKNLKPGDQVATNDRQIGWSEHGHRIQTVVKISAKRTQFTVADSSGKETVFDKYGYHRTGSGWSSSSSHITEVTPEIKAQMVKDSVLVKTKNVVRALAEKISYQGAGVVNQLDTDQQERLYVLATEMYEMVKEK